MTGVGYDRDMRIFILTVLLAAGAWAQSNPLTQAIMSRYNTAKQNLIETAEAMPESEYGYKLSPAQRPFGAWIEHTAQGNYGYCTAIKGAAADSSPKVPHEMKAKPELVKAIKDSFEYCDEALKGMDDQKALAMVNGKAPVTPMVSIVVSLNEHYGNLVGYLRTKGITPPSTARAAAAKK